MPVVLFPVMPPLALDTGGDSRLQEYRVEGLEQVIVCAGLNASNNLIHVLTPTDHNHGRRAEISVLFHLL